MLNLFDMVTQKPVLVKIDSQVLFLLDQLVLSIGINRNKFINFALKVAVENMAYYRESLLTSVYSRCFDLED